MLPPNTLKNLPAIPEESHIASLRSNILTLADPTEKWEALTNALIEWFPETPQITEKIQEEINEAAARTMGCRYCPPFRAPLTEEQNFLMSYAFTHLEDIPDEVRIFPETSARKFLGLRPQALSQGEQMILQLCRSLTIPSGLLLREPLEYISSQEGISILGLGSTKLSCNDIPTLIQSPLAPHVTTLDIGGNQLGELGTKAFVENPNHFTGVKKLVAYSSFLNGESLERFMSWPGMHQLTHLDISSNSMNPEGARIFVNALKSAHLQELNLYNNQIGQEGAELIAQCPHFAHLTSLDLRTNGIGEAGFQALAQSPYMANLESLRVSISNEEGTAVQSLVESPYLKKLTSLEFSYTSISTEMMEAFAQWPRLKAITHLDLHYNNIQVAQLAPLIQSPYLENLTSLNLGSNYHLNREGLELIVAKDFPNLKYLNIRYSGVAEEADLLEALERKIETVVVMPLR